MYRYKGGRQSGTGSNRLQVTTECTYISVLASLKIKGGIRAGVTIEIFI